MGSFEKLPTFFNNSIYSLQKKFLIWEISMLKIINKIIFTIVFSVFVFNSFLFSGTGGKISGTVKSAKDGSPIIGTNVIVVGESMGAASDANGYFSILNIPPGTYEIMVSTIGYKTIRMKNIRVTVDETTTINFQMETSVLKGEEVVVIAKRPLVKKDLTSSKVTISDKDLELAPVESFKDILSTKAGVTEGTDGSLHIRGGRASEVQYMIDGIPVSSDVGLSLSKNVISELTLISGTFNAEYGKAMSGIVNIATKEGAEHYEGNLSYQLGDMYSNHTDVFTDVDEFDPLTFTRLDFDVSGPVPIIPKSSFFITGTYTGSDGWLYGFKEHNTMDMYSFVGDDWNILMTGDSSRVAMNTNTSRKMMAKFSIKPFDKTKIVYQFNGNDGEWQNYVHRWKYNPDGRYNHESRNYLHALHFTQTVSEKTYFTLKFSYKDHYAEDYLHKIKPYTFNEDLDGDGRIDTLSYSSGFSEDLNNNGILDTALTIDWDFIKKYGAFIPNDTWYTVSINDSTEIDIPNYVSNVSKSDVPAYHFYYGGQQMEYDITDYQTYTAKFDLTSQLSKSHQIRTGAEYNYYNRHIINSTIEMSSRTQWLPYIASSEYAGHDDYTNNPYDFSAYLQDKMEYEDIIIQAGLRYDYFNANDYDFTNEIHPQGSDTLRVKAKQQISPRLGVSFPITDQGFIHFSYGHFFQMPEFSYLYRNPELKKSTEITIFGNPDLNAQKTVMYELGLQQQLSSTTAFDLTVYYRDIINWLSSEYNFIDNTFRYTKYITQDYGNIRGVAVSFTQRSRQGLALNLDYTFQIAEGNASSPDAAYYDNLNNVESEKHPVPLDWDVRHSLNATITVNASNNLGMSLINRFSTGKPYTPNIQGMRSAEENSDSRPFLFTTDFRVYKNVMFGKQRIGISLKIYNLFDRKNQRYVFSDTGSSGYTLIPTYAGQSLAEHSGVSGLHTLDEYLYSPTNYSNPRQILVQISWHFQ